MSFVKSWNKEATQRSPHIPCYIRLTKRGFGSVGHLRTDSLWWTTISSPLLLATNTTSVKRDFHFTLHKSELCFRFKSDLSILSQSDDRSSQSPIYRLGCIRGGTKSQFAQTRENHSFWLRWDIWVNTRIQTFTSWPPSQRTNFCFREVNRHEKALQT